MGPVVLGMLEMMLDYSKRGFPCREGSVSDEPDGTQYFVHRNTGLLSNSKQLTVQQASDRTDRMKCGQQNWVKKVCK